MRETLPWVNQRCGKIDRSERWKLRKTCSDKRDQCEKEAECCRKGYELKKSEVDSTRQGHLMDTWYQFTSDDGVHMAHRRTGDIQDRTGEQRLDRDLSQPLETQVIAMSYAELSTIRRSRKAHGWTVGMKVVFRKRQATPRRPNPIFEDRALRLARSFPLDHT